MFLPFVLGATILISIFWLTVPCLIALLAWVVFGQTVGIILFGLIGFVALLLVLAATLIGSPLFTGKFPWET